MKFDLQAEDLSGAWHNVWLINHVCIAAKTGRNLTLYDCLKESHSGASQDCVPDPIIDGEKTTE